LDGDGLSGTEAKPRGKRSAEGKGEIGHFVIGGDEALKYPRADLFFAIGLVWGKVPRSYRLIEEEWKHLL
jgi:hypothetical protein